VKEGCQERRSSARLAGTVFFTEVPFCTLLAEKSVVPSSALIVPGAERSIGSEGSWTLREDI